MMEAAAERADVIPTPPRTHVTHAWLTAFPYAELEAEAQRRRIHPDRLTAKIVEKVILGGLVDQLLG